MLREGRRQRAEGRRQRTEGRGQRARDGSRILPRGLVVGLILGWCWGSMTSSVLAQINPDNTLGAEGSIVRPNVSLDGLPADLIEGGAARGVNLFHSFADFKVGDGQRVYFANPVGIDNILSRVTGSSRSDILGTLGVAGGANLFLLNPNGILFGPNAQLDIRGSFVASTADSFDFGNGLSYSATHPQAPPLLKISVPIGLQYGSNRAGTITSSGNLAAGKDLILDAGNLDLAGQLLAGGNLTLKALDTVRIRDSAAVPFIAAAGRELEIQGDGNVDIFALNHPHSGLFSGSDMVLRSAETVVGDAHYWSGGSFRIEQLDGSLGNLLSPHDPVIRSTGDVAIQNYEGTSLHILAGGEVKIDTVVIKGPDTVADTINPSATPALANVTLSDGTPIVINGNARPTLDVRAGMNPAMIGTPGTIGATLPNDIFFQILPFLQLPPGHAPPFFSPDGTLTYGIVSTPTSANITIGDIKIDESVSDGMVVLSNQYRPNLSLPGGDIILTKGSLAFGISTLSVGGDGGSVTLDARRQIRFQNGASINTSSVAGDAENVKLLAQGDIIFSPNSFSAPTIEAVGRSGGDVTLESRNGTVSLNDTGVVSITTKARTGRNITLAGRSVELNNLSRVTTLNLGAGAGGHIQMKADDRVKIQHEGGTSLINSANPLVQDLLSDLTGTGIGTTTAGSGKAGDITIETRELIVRNNDQTREKVAVGITTANLSGSSGASGDITILARDRVDIQANDAGTFAAASSASLIDDVLSLRTGITAATKGAGNAGNITVDTQQLTIRDGGGITTGVLRNSSGNGGNLTVNASQVDLQGRSSLIAGTISSSRAGSLTINAPGGHITLGDGAALLTASNSSGEAGKLAIDTAQLEVKGGSQIVSGTAGTGIAAAIQVNASDRIEVVGVSTDGLSASTLSAGTAGSGNAGDINLSTPFLSIRDGGQISAETFSNGDAGTLDIQAIAIEVVGTAPDGNPSAITARTASRGNAGNAILSATHLSVREGGQISVESSGSGNAGTVDVRTTSLDIAGVSAATGVPSDITARTSGAGNAGGVQVNTEQLFLSGGGRISANTSGSGNAGTLAVNASRAIVATGRSPDGRFRSGFRFDTSSSGDARGIELRVGDDLQLRDGGQVTVSGTGSGKAGDIAIRARNVLLTHQGRIAAETLSGEGGNIDIKVDESIVLRFNSEITTEARGTGNGGNITLEAEDFIWAVLSENSDIVANAFQGQGGNIRAKAEGVFGFRQFRDRRTVESDFIASSALGIDGTVTLDVRDFQPDAALTEQFAEAAVDQGCRTPRHKTARQSGRNTFVITGRGGIAPDPSQPLGGNSISVPWVGFFPNTENVASPVQEAAVIDSSSNKIVEAKGWERLSDGSIRLTANLSPPKLLPQCMENRDVP